MQFIKDLLIILSGFLTPIIAVITTYIAIRQYKNSKYKIKLDLYEKRYSVYSSLMKFLDLIVRDGSVTLEDINKYLIETNESVFLFDKEIRVYLECIHNKANEVRLTSIKLDDNILPTGEERNKIANKNYELNCWFGEQLKEANKLFMKYLYVKF